MSDKNEVSITFKFVSYDAAQHITALVEVAKILNRDMFSPVTGEGLAHFLSDLLEVTYPRGGKTPLLFANMILSEPNEEHWTYIADMCATIAKQIHREVFPICDKKESK